ncbi:MAG: hypothetical protein HYZ49_11010 [Chloroflexi bacterium]|nr:hypothetical protein [Chloroflexota bacterium]
MRPEYDFSDGVRGKYAKTLRENGYVIRVRHADGTFTERRVLGENAVILEPDVREYFPNSRAVNNTLRTLIKLFPAKRKAAASKGRNGRTRQAIGRKRR